MPKSFTLPNRSIKVGLHFFKSIRSYLNPLKFFIPLKNEK